MGGGGGREEEGGRRGEEHISHVLATNLIYIIFFRSQNDRVAVQFVLNTQITIWRWLLIIFITYHYC